MRRNSNFFNFFISIIFTLASLFVIIYLVLQRYGGIDFTKALVMVAFAILSGVLHTFFHELGHLVFGLKNGFKFNAMTILFFNWSKVKDKIKFNFVMIRQEAGFTEMIPSSPEVVAKGLKKMTFGGLFFSFLLTLVGVISFVIQGLPVYVFLLLAMFLPVGAYVFLGNAVPYYADGVRNDGAVLKGLRKNDAVSQVCVGVLKIQAMLYNGYAPSEIEESCYFDLPVIQEDDVNFIMLLNLRYLYYLDKEDYLNAKKVNDRLSMIAEHFSSSIYTSIKIDELYACCTYNLNEDKADDLMYELEKYLNAVNNAVTVRTKLAYLLYVAREYDNLNLFYEKGLREIEKLPLSGIRKLEIKLYNKLKDDIDKI